MARGGQKEDNTKRGWLLELTMEVRSKKERGKGGHVKIGTRLLFRDPFLPRAKTKCTRHRALKTHGDDGVELFYFSFHFLFCQSAPPDEGRDES